MKTLGGIVVLVGILGGIAGYVLFPHSFSSKKLDLALVLAVVFLIGGIVMAVMPNKSGTPA